MVDSRRAANDAVFFEYRSHWFFGTCPAAFWRAHLLGLTLLF
jgi:hypothetical protein